MQVTYNARAFVNEDGQVSVGLSMDGREQPSQSGTREVSRSFALEVLTKQGDEGERAAAEWLRSKGWDVGKPKAIVLEHVGLDGFARWAVSLDGPNPETAIPVPGRSEAHDLAAKFNSMGSEKPDLYRTAAEFFAEKAKPAAKEKKPDLPALYREAAWKVRALTTPGLATAPATIHTAREALITCAKADPETAEGLIIQADLIHDYNDKQLHVVADDLEKCARLSETAADVAMLRLSSDLADRVKRYVEAITTPSGEATAPPW